MAYKYRKDQIRKNRLWRENNRPKARTHVKRSMLKRLYGISLEQYDAMLIDSCGKCTLCGLNFSDAKDDPSVDHCHDTGKVRALIHARCNRGLGSFKDSIEMLEQAVAYLKRFKEQPDATAF